MEKYHLRERVKRSRNYLPAIFVISMYNNIYFNMHILSLYQGFTLKLAGYFATQIFETVKT